MFKKLRGIFSNDLIYRFRYCQHSYLRQADSIVLDEPSVVAIRQDRNRAGKSVAAVGARSETNAWSYSG